MAALPTYVISALENRWQRTRQVLNDLPCVLSGVSLPSLAAICPPQRLCGPAPLIRYALSHAECFLHGHLLEHKHQKGDLTQVMWGVQVLATLHMQSTRIVPLKPSAKLAHEARKRHDYDQYADMDDPITWRYFSLTVTWERLMHHILARHRHGGRRLCVHYSRTTLRCTTTFPLHCSPGDLAQHGAGAR